MTEAAGPRAIAVLKLRRGRERSVLDRHPWIFSGAVQSPPPCDDGSIVAVADWQGRTLGAGFFHPQASLCCRLFHFGEELPDFDDRFWQARLAGALQRRRAYPLHRDDSFRLCNGEADGLPGLIVDVLGRCAVLQFRESAMERFGDAVVDFLRSELAIETALDRTGEDRQGDRRHRDLLGVAPESIELMENGFRYRIDLNHAHKTGYYLDQKINRQIFEGFAAGRRVLDAFCYSGSFSLHALRGGATSVVSVDASPRSIEECQQNRQLNLGEDRRHRSERADLVAWLREGDEEFDLISLDPPAFARTRAALENALRGYREINLQAIRRTAANGFLFTYSCSQYVTTELFQKAVFQAARDAGRQVNVLQRLGPAPDHPFSLFHPEGEYLKGLLLQVF